MSKNRQLKIKFLLKAQKNLNLKQYYEQLKIKQALITMLYLKIGIESTLNKEIAEIKKNNDKKYEDLVRKLGKR